MWATDYVKAFLGIKQSGTVCAKTYDPQPGAAIPDDDANNKLMVANPEDTKLRHISIAGGTWTRMRRRSN
jgi:hypothetical protein